ncbi:MAG TPA: CBS domain-containing protein [Candidatus Binatia bacterium]|jgi:CBS domain-containing protein
MGYTHVFAYEGGKAEWMAFDLPIVRGRDLPALVSDVVERDVPRCRPEDSIGAARDAAYDRGMDICPVVNDAGVLLGLCTRVSLHAHPSIAVELVMEPGPTTVRPSMPVKDAVKMLERKKVRSPLVTTPDGKLIGSLNDGAAASARDDARKGIST